MRQIVDALAPLPRDIVSDGYDVALEALSNQLPLQIHEYPSGSACWTWEIPDKWSCLGARLESVDGRCIFSTDDDPLHVVVTHGRATREAEATCEQSF